MNVSDLTGGRDTDRAPEVGRSDEADLIERCRRGDAGAFDHLLTIHQDAVYRTALRLMGDPDEAFDLAQDVLLTSFRKIDQFRGGAKFSTWLHRITVNHARNRWKAASRRPKVVSIEGGFPTNDADDSAPLDVADEGPDPRERAAAGEIVRALQRAIAALPELYREVIVLRHVEDLSYEEIAEATESNLGTVKSRISRGREMLRKELGPMLDEFLGDNG